MKSILNGSFCIASLGFFFPIGFLDQKVYVVQNFLGGVELT